MVGRYGLAGAGRGACGGRRPRLAPSSRLAHGPPAEGKVPCAREYFERGRRRRHPRKCGAALTSSSIVIRRGVERQCPPEEERAAPGPCSPCEGRTPRLAGLSASHSVVSADCAQGNPAVPTQCSETETRARRPPPGRLPPWPGLPHPQDNTSGYRHSGRPGSHTTHEHGPAGRTSQCRATLVIVSKGDKSF